MIDLIAKNLTAEQQATVKEFRDFTWGVLTREEDHQKAAALREAIGKQLCSFSNLDWAMLVTMAFHSASNNYRSLGWDKIKHPTLTLRKGPVREAVIAYRAFIDSCIKDQDKWLVNLGYEVTGDVIGGLLSGVVTMTEPKNTKHFDELFAFTEGEIVPMVTNTFAQSIGATEGEINLPKVEKESICRAAGRLMQFCMDNKDGFAIC